MVTEADREAAARVFDEIARKSGHPEVATLNRSYAQKIRAGDGDDFDAVRAAVNSRTASTAALTAENQRLRARARDALTVLGFRFEMRGGMRLKIEENGGVGVGTCDEAVMYDALEDIAALSTPSEVTSPNPDEVAGTYSAFKVSEPVADHIGGEGDTIDQEALARWRGIANEGDGHDQAGLNKNTLRRLIATIDALATPPNPTNGDAVREALVEMGEAAFKEGLLAGWQSGRAGEAMPPEYVQASWERSDALATLAKHGGAEA